MSAPPTDLEMQCDSIGSLLDKAAEDLGMLRLEIRGRAIDRRDLLTEALDLLEKNEWFHDAEWGDRCGHCHGFKNGGIFDPPGTPPGHHDACPWLALMRKAGRR